jgi:thiol-disulfide isomerase/thioredoxin
MRRLIASLLAAWLMLGLAGVSVAKGLEGKPAPKLELKGEDGQKHTLATLAAGRPTVVLFWASWCPYCEALMPHLARLASQYNDRIAVVAVSVWEEQGVDPFVVMRDRGHPFVVLAKGDKQTKKWGVKGTPGLFVLDASGKVVFDRNAHVYTTSASGETGMTDRRTGIQRSARMWADAVAEALATQLTSG